MCDSGAITITFQKGFYLTRIREELCTHCGKCVSVCPGESFRRQREKPREFKPDFIGQFRYGKAFLAHSSDANVRKASSSGGVANTAVRHLLTNRLVDEAIIVAIKEDAPFAQSVCIKDSEPLRRNPRDFASRYVVVPIVGDMRKSRGLDVVITGLPCQIRAAKEVAKALGCHVTAIGITCSSGTSSNATTQFIRDLGMKDAKSIYYRGDGWPGKVSVSAIRDGKLLTCEEPYLTGHFVEIYGSNLYRLPGCWFCTDHFAEEADITLFDFWARDHIDERQQGQTGVIVRTTRMQGAIEEMINRGELEIESELTLDQILDSQAAALLMKTRAYGQRPANITARMLNLIVLFLRLWNPHKRIHSRIIVHLFSVIMNKCISNARYC